MKIKEINKFAVKVLIVVLSFVFLISCEDEPPNIYTQRYYVEGYLYVDHSPSGIKVFNTQPIGDVYDPDKAMVKDADVKIKDANGNVYDLVYRDGDEPGYYYPGEDLIVEKQKKYKLEVNTLDGKYMWAETTTPDTISWIKPPKEVIYYPKEDGNLNEVDSLEIQWTPAENTNFYLLYTISRDTLEYGKYLNPPTDEPNRRIKNLFSDRGGSSDYYKNVTFMTIIANTKTPTVWLAFKWFGPHYVDILVPDFNLLKWFVQTNWSASVYDPLSNSIQGDGFGVFGSAYRISQEMMLMKPVEE
jgi:hypothetical protein